MIYIYSEYMVLALEQLYLALSRCQGFRRIVMIVNLLSFSSLDHTFNKRVASLPVTFVISHTNYARTPCHTIPNYIMKLQLPAGTGWWPRYYGDQMCLNLGYYHVRGLLPMLRVCNIVIE